MDRKKSPGERVTGPTEKEGPANGALRCTHVLCETDRQAAGASNCQLLGKMTASMACTMPFVATISALLTRAPLTRTSDVDTTAVIGVPCAVATSPPLRSLAMK